LRHDSEDIATNKMSDDDAAKKWVDANPDNVKAWLAQSWLGP